MGIQPIHLLQQQIEINKTIWSSPQETETIISRMIIIVQYILWALLGDGGTETAPLHDLIISMISGIRYSLMVSGYTFLLLK